MQVAVNVRREVVFGGEVKIAEANVCISTGTTVQDDHEPGSEMHVHVSSDTGAGRMQCGCGFLLKGMW